MILQELALGPVREWDPKGDSSGAGTGPGEGVGPEG